MIFFRCLGLIVIVFCLLPVQLLAADLSTNSGSETYKLICATCHEQGLSGAPLTNKKADWTFRIKKGFPLLYAHVIAGLGKMPPRGGCITCTDDALQAAVDYMLKPYTYEEKAKQFIPASLSFSDLMMLGKQKYDVYCASCHKQDGSGTILEYPALKKSILGSSFMTVDKPIDRQIALILQGVSGTEMASFSQLSDTDLAAIVTYVRNAWCNNTKDIIQPNDIKSVRTKLAQRKVSSVKKVLTLKEAMKIGEEFYQAYCARCHQLNGEGRAPYGPTLKGSYLATDPALQNYLIKLVLEGAPGTRMRGYRQQLNDDEIAAILTYVGNAWGNNNQKVIQPAVIATIGTALKNQELRTNNAMNNVSDMIANGRIIYNAYCARCHKLDGTGGAQVSVPSLIGSPIITQQGIKTHIDIILTGVPGSIMRAFAYRLTDAEVAQVVAYERYKFNGKKDLSRVIDVSEERIRLKTQIDYQMRNQLKQQFLQDEKLSATNCSP